MQIKYQETKLATITDKEANRITLNVLLGMQVGDGIREIDGIEYNFKWDESYHGSDTYTILGEATDLDKALRVLIREVRNR